MMPITTRVTMLQIGLVPGCLLLALFAPVADAKLINGVNSGDWENPATWDTGVPGDADRWFIRTFATNPIQVIIDDDSDLPTLSFGFAQSSIGGNDGGVAELVQSAGNMFFHHELRLGDDFAMVSDTTGIYRLSGGSLLIKGDSVLGTTNNANFRMDSGVNNIFNIIGADATQIEMDRFVMSDPDAPHSNPNATLDFDITAAGITPIDVNLRANFNKGTLDVDFVDFTPSVGTVYTLVNGSPNGTSFASFDATADSLLGSDTIQLELMIVDDGSANAGVSVRVMLAMTLLGDANKDGSVTGADLISVQQNFGKVGPVPLQGDANDSGEVTGADLISVQQNFGNVVAAAPVPEPAAAILLVLVALARRKQDR